jgi:NADH-quinone oxidoreductase subunit G
MLQGAARGAGPERIGFLAAPGCTAEEGFLLQRLARGLGCHNVDSRLRQADFSGQRQDPPFPGLGAALRDLESLSGLLLAGCHVRSESPILAHRVRKAALAGCQVSFLATAAQQSHFPVHAQIVATPAELPAQMAALAAGTGLSTSQQAVRDSLSGGRAAIVLGGVAMRHSRYAALRAAAARLALATGATLGYLPDGANAAGLALAGVLPHRLPGAKPDPQAGLDVAGMLGAELAACVLLGGIEPGHDIGLAGASARLAACPKVIAITPYADPEVMKFAQLLLPMGTFAETSGTYVNVEGRWQEFRGCAQPVGEARPGWKILRVVGNQLGLEGFAQDSSADVLAELQAAASGITYDGRADAGAADGTQAGGTTMEVPIYAVDAIVRRSPSLQQTHAARHAAGGG